MITNQQLFEGDVDALVREYPPHPNSTKDSPFDQSRADMALMCRIGLELDCDAERMVKIFDQSALASRSKWQNSDDYQIRTVTKAIAWIKARHDPETIFSDLGGVPGDGSVTDIIELKLAQAPAKEINGLELALLIEAGKDPLVLAAKEEQAALGQFLAKEGIEHLTEFGNAKRLVTRHGIDLRFVAENKTWYVWNQKRWVPDALGQVRVLAKETVLSIYAEAKQGADAKQRKAVGDWAHKSETKRAIDAMISLASCEHGIAIRHAEMDADPYLLNCQNGTLNLKNGQLYQHSRGNLISKICEVEYRAFAECPLLDSFLDRVMPDTDLLRFVQVAVGLSLLGIVPEEVLLFVYGEPASGKSTLLEAVNSIMGDYAMKASAATFMKRHSGSEIQSGLIRLKGARFVSVTEIDRGAIMAEALVKQITGGDTVAGRDLHSKEIEYQPQCTLWLCANDQPIVRDDDEGMWRRMRQIPFNEVIPKNERDPDIKIALKDPTRSGPALLAWMVQGCLDYQARGLPTCGMVEKATQSYRREMNPIQAWLDECCTLTVGLCFESTSALHDSYATFIYPTKPITKAVFAKRLAKMKFPSIRNGQIRGFGNIELHVGGGSNHDQ